MRKVLCGLLSLAMMLVLIACGQKTADGPTWQEQYDLGMRYLSEGNYQEAILAFTAAIEIDPRNADAYLGRAEAYIGSGENEVNLAAALADYEKLLELDESNAAAWLGLADVYIRLGDFDKALEVLKEGLEECGDGARIAEKIAELESGNVSDSSGKTRRKSTYDGEGNLIWYHTYTYDEQGRSASVTSFDGQGNQTGHVDEMYDNQGNRIVTYYYINHSGQIGRIERDFDENGDEIESRHYDADTGEIITRHRSIRDVEGRNIREEQYRCRDGVEELDGYYTTEYDEQGHRAKYSFYSPDGTVTWYTVYTYLENGKTNERCNYDGDGKLTKKEVYLYDDQGKFIGSEEYDAEGNLLQSTVYE